MVRPTTGRPWRCRRPATTELSAPPDMATATGATVVSGAGKERLLSGGDAAAKLAGGGDDGAGEGVGVGGRVVAAEGETDAGFCLLACAADGEQDRGRLD